jgi:hypothetical protein
MAKTITRKHKWLESCEEGIHKSNPNIHYSHTFYPFFYHSTGTSEILRSSIMLPKTILLNSDQIILIVFGIQRIHQSKRMKCKADFKRAVLLAP